MWKALLIMNMRLLGKISKNILERVDVLRKERISEKSEKQKDKLAAGIIITAVLLCILLSFFGFLENREAVEAAARTAAQAAAQAGKTPSASESESKGEKADGAQLSDPLLVLVNDWTPLPEDWRVTPRMIDDEQVDLRMYEDLTAMFSAAAEDNVWFWVASGYRSVEEQEVILDRAVRENRERGMSGAEAEREALKTIARPGYSEHHTGLAVDLNDVSDNFEETEAYRWLSRHAAEYGFVQRYQKDKVTITGIDNESWHYRYVGKKHAKEMDRLDLCLEEYVMYLKKQGVK